MERIELFDNYINNQLSDAQRSEFDARLESDEEFASDFKVYLLTVNGICREAHQDNLDFGMAMKSLSKEKLKEIVGMRNLESPEVSSNGKSVKILRFKPWMWQVASIAAVVVIAFTVVFNIEKNARYSVDKAICACAEISTDLTRDGSEILDIQSMTDEELTNKLPLLVANYNSAQSYDAIADNGFALAMAYLRLHDRENAKEILQKLVSQFEDNSEYSGYVSKWQSILNVLK
ncbi:hypothetical protein [Bacteroides acidifaciens]|uniref:hypothetical protein n=1 Tax=Bacteroides acidifaciens TaxID=85831 RepID=UPI002557D33B|nr:hypothetical protein [Bacteroides acidifaciens]